MQLAIVEEEKFLTAGAKCIPWDHRDSKLLLFVSRTETNA